MNGEAPNPYAAPQARSEPPSAAPAPLLEDAEPAGFGVRAGARIIDTLVSYAVGMSGAFVVGFVVGLARKSGAHVGSTQSASSFETIALGFLLSSAGTLGYHVLSEGIGGASFGKLVLGLRVRAGDFSPPTLKGAFIRGIAYYIDAFFFGAVAYSSMSNSPMFQRYGDKWGDTVVVRAPSLPHDPDAGLRLGLGLGTGIAFNLVALMASALLQIT